MREMPRASLTIDENRAQGQPGTELTKNRGQSRVDVNSSSSVKGSFATLTIYST